MSCDPPHGFSDGAHPAPAPEDMALAHLGLDLDEQAILTITRYYCQSFADPASQS